MKKILMLMGLAAAACSGGAKDSVTLSARLSSASGQALPTDGGSAQVASGIELTRIRIAIRRLRVERKDSASEVEISQGPLLLDASGDALAGALLELVTSKVPAGTYDKLKVDIHRVETAPSAAFDDLAKRGASILLEGTVDAQPFVFASALEAEIEHEGQFDLGGAAANITLSLDASQWFKAADGSRLDPRESSTRQAIERNIGASFSAFEDDDHDGADDRGHHDGGDDRGEDGGSHDAGDDHGGDGGSHDAGDDHGGDGGSGSDDGSGHH
jgi:hypothetical protein